MHKNDILPRLYVAGWAGTYIKGTIDMTKKESLMTVSSIFEDIAHEIIPKME